ncbi:MAG TPA: tetratricopeptide repeat protein [Micromonosporaceae bacterium]
MADAVDAEIEQAHGELSLARIALAEDDLRHAANHLAAAIAHAPRLPEVHELLAALAARTSDALSLFPIEEQNFVGTVVAHAHLLARTDPAGALTLLAQASAFDPEQPWADVSWVYDVDVAAVDPDALARIFVTVMRSLGDPTPEEIRRANETYLDLARRAVDAHPDHALLHGTAAGIGRRLGATALAVRWGERAVHLDRNKLTSVWYAYALKADGRLDDALRVMTQARRQNPLDLDLCADMASWLADAGRLDEALAVIDEATRIDPTYDCAVHTAHRLRFQRDGDVNHLVALADFIREHPVTSHEHSDLERSCARRPWLGRLTPPTEACVNLLTRLAEAAPSGHASTVSLSGLEVPSAIALLRREYPGIQVRVAGPPPADMVNPLRPGRVLWRYDGTTAYPTVEPAGARAAALLSEIATPVWTHPVAAYDHALPLGQLPAEELLSLLVHPPTRPDGYAKLPYGWWERSAQVFACLGILHCAELGSGRPGDTSAQRRLLTEIAYGVEDWTTEAALFALTVAAWIDPSCRDEVRETVGHRFCDAAAAASGRVVTILYSLAELVRIVPGMLPEVVALAKDVLDTPDKEVPVDQQAAAKVRAPGATRSLLRRILGF